jgi:hypothetical protein
VWSEWAFLSLESQRLACAFDKVGQRGEALHVTHQAYQQDAGAFQIGEPANVTKLQRE